MHRDSSSAVYAGTNTSISSGSSESYRFNTNSGSRNKDVVSAAAHSHGVGFYDNSYTSGPHLTHTHSYSFDTSYNGSSTDTESRPDNLTIKIWKRVL